MVYQGAEGIHVSGHAQKEELKLMHSIIKPKYFMPAHGEYKMLSKHKDLAMELGMKEENIFVMKNGDILEIGDKAKVNGEAPNGLIMIDGLGIGDVGNIVLKEKKAKRRRSFRRSCFSYQRESRKRSWYCISWICIHERK